MAKWDKYSPDYQKLYPGVQISPEVMAVLKQSDRKMRYQAVDLKAERIITVQDTDAVRFIPRRKDSLERLIEEKSAAFWDEQENTENQVMQKISVEEIHKALAQLDNGERALIEALFFEGLTERAYAEKIGLSQPMVHKKKVRILDLQNSPKTGGTSGWTP